MQEPLASLCNRQSMRTTFRLTASA